MPARRTTSKRQPQPTVAQRSLAVAGGALGALGGIVAAAGLGVVSLVAARPLAFLGSAAFLTLSGVVASNALFGQGGAHPQPMLATRAVELVNTAGAAPAAVEPWRPVNDPRIMTVPLVRDVQVLLAEAGYYQAEIDGRPGQATDRAIRAFQAERGLRVDGMATPLLLTQIRQMTTDAPSPQTRPDGEQYASLEELMSDVTTGGIAPGAGSDRELVRRIQTALNETAVAELKADGIMGAQTRAAIRAFQELEGMEVTGEPSPELLTRLSELTAGN
ncbi:peptidoglycan-binding domain-containing protein [Aureimonas populi]|uniref:Peptidoglycan-binding protein n=1 Tax=Aureimonas populi TaxID=1701758 RepID=A0ABW5CMQ5_9HYPH|nr:peptidoglycan-binding protein [Aureimonas populi]